MSPPQLTSRRTRAFTLIELLTVIAIIGILAAIIIPTVGKVRASAQNAQCVARLRDWGRAVHLHAADNKGKYQTSNWLSGASNPYLRYFPRVVGSGGVIRPEYFASCPLLIKSTASAPFVSYSMVWPSINGDINTLLPNPSPNQFVDLNKARSPSKFLVMCDSMSGASPRVNANLLDEYVGPLMGKPIINAGSRGDETVAKRHGGSKANGVFGDGSVKSITGSPLGSGDTSSIYEMRTTWFQLY